MNTEPTLSDLEDQESTSQEDLESELRGIFCDLGNVRRVMCVAKHEEKLLMTRRNWIRVQLNMLREPAHITLSAEVAPERTLPHVSSLPAYASFNGTTEPTCPDCTPNDD